MKTSFSRNFDAFLGLWVRHGNYEQLRSLAEDILINDDRLPEYVNRSLVRFYENPSTENLEGLLREMLKSGEGMDKQVYVVSICKAIIDKFVDVSLGASLLAELMTGRETSLTQEQKYAVQVGYLVNHDEEDKWMRADADQLMQDAAEAVIRSKTDTFQGKQ